jgi:hypothetical protein
MRRPMITFPHPTEMHRHQLDEDYTPVLTEDHQDEMLAQITELNAQINSALAFPFSFQNAPMIAALVSARNGTVTALSRVWRTREE